MKKFLVKLICFFIPIKKYRKRCKVFLKNWLGGGVSSLYNPKARGNVLISYMKDSVLLKDDDVRLKYHTNRWENREIARIFYELGYNVDCIDFNCSFYPSKQYDVMFGICGRFSEFKDFLTPDALKILYLTGSYGKYNYEKEKDRLVYLEQRRGVRLALERATKGGSDTSFENADVCLLVGNEHTLKTYPKRFQNKINLINLTGSLLSMVKTPSEYYPKEKEFLWMGGAGPVHKGLDLLLDIFAKHPEWTLNVMSKINPKSQFFKLYKKELTQLPNIHFHGLVMPSSEKFEKIVSRCFAYINPSCAEATSTATVTAMSVGLYPIISYDNGFTLPKGCGTYLDKCSLEEIETAIDELWHKDKSDVCEQISKVHQMTLKDFSRENFHNQMLQFLSEQIKQHFEETTSQNKIKAKNA